MPAEFLDGQSASELLPLAPPDAPVRGSGTRQNARSALMGALFGSTLAVVAAVIVMSIDRTWLRTTFAPLPSRWITIPLLLVVMWFVILVHESGHVIAGLLMRFRFLYLVVGPLRVEHSEGTGLRFKLNRDLSLAGGIAGCAPVDDHDLSRRFGWMVFGGPLANLLLAAAALLLMQLDMPPVVRAFTVIAGFMSLANGLGTLLPMPNGAFLNDGARLLHQLRGGAEARRDVALLSLTVAIRSPQRIGDWNPALVRAALSPVDGSVFEMQARLMAYMWQIERGAVEQARHQLTRAIALTTGLPASFATSLKAEAAFCAARFDNDAATAREMSGDNVRGWERLPERTRLRVDAAIALAEHREADARDLVTRALAELAKVTPRMGVIDWEEDQLTSMLQQRA